MIWGAGLTPRIRGLPYKLPTPDQALPIASILWKDIYARRIFARAAATVSGETPIEATPTSTAEKRIRAVR